MDPLWSPGSEAAVREEIRGIVTGCLIKRALRGFYEARFLSKARFSGSPASLLIQVLVILLIGAITRQFALALSDAINPGPDRA